jgi:Spy/CpxP family protein refolding chaperone
MQKETFCMKHFVTGILTLLWAAGGIAMAQAPTQEIGTSHGSMVAIPGFLPPAIDQTDPAGYWAGILGLDAGQQASMRSILADQQSSTDALKSKLTGALAALTAAAKANSADSEIDRLSADLGAIFSQAVAVQAKAYARLSAMLSPDQKQRLEKATALPAGATFSVVGHAVAGAAVRQ